MVFVISLLNQVIVVVEGQAHLLESTDGAAVVQNEVKDLRSSQEEKDTSIVSFVCQIWCLQRIFKHKSQKSRQ